MREIKFRQPILKLDGSFDHFHYWGILEDSFVGRDCSGNKKGDDQQYIGLHDKNGKEIYEGDIVRTFSRVGRGFRDRGVDKVHYSDITARWYPPDIVVTEMCEIIGDIYKNPELLKEAK